MPLPAVLIAQDQDRAGVRGICRSRRDFREGRAVSDIRHAQETLIRRITEGQGTASEDDRRAAFENAGIAAPLTTLVEKTATRPDAVTDDDIFAARAAGFSEDQLFE